MARSGSFRATLAIYVGLALLPAALVLVAALAAPGEAWAALRAPELWTRFATSSWLAAAAAALAIPLGVALAWSCVRTDMPGRSTWLSIAPLALCLPPLVHVLTWFELLRWSGMAAIVTVYALSYTPLVTLLAARALAAVSQSHVDTLRLLGGTRLVLRDEWRQALPAALVGASLLVVLVLSDFAVADFLSAVGPKVTVYGESLYVHYLAGNAPGEAAASLPGLVAMLALLAWALRRRRALGAALDSRFTPAPPHRLGRWRWPAALLAATVSGGPALLPLVVLAWRAGELATVTRQVQLAWDRIWFSIAVSALAATFMLLFALPLARGALRARRPWRLDLLVLVPLGIPALLTGVGLVRVWNHGWLADAIPAYDRWFYEGAGILVVALVGRYLAIAYLPLGGVLERIGRGPEEAARLVGATAWQRWTRIMLPLLGRGALLAWVLSFCFALRDLDGLQVLSAGQRTLPHWLYSNVIFARESEVAALALLLCAATYLPLVPALLAVRRTGRGL